MIQLSDLFTLQLELFLLLAAGFYFRKRVVGAAFEKGLTDVILDLILPCNIVTSFQIEMSAGLLRSTFSVLAVSMANQLACLTLGAAVYRRRPREKWPVMKYGSLCSNAGFLGTPVAEGIWGPQGVMLASIYLIPQRIFMWSVGVGFFHREEKNVALKLLTNPCILASAAGLALMAAQASLPPFLDKTVHALGQCNTGMSMFLIGMVASRIRPRDFLDRDVLYLTAVRLGLIPLLVFLGCRLLAVDQLTAGVAVLLAAMPLAGTSAVLAARYDAAPEFAASAVAVSTALSMVAIPLWGLLLR